MQRLPRRLLALALSTMLVGVLGGAEAQAVSSESTAAYAATATRITSLAAQVVDSYRRRSSADDPRYYGNGLWTSDRMGCWTCNLGPAVASAVLSRDDPTLLPIAIDSFDRAIADHQAPDGSFVGGDSGPGINDAFFGPQIGAALIVLGDRLEPATKARWTAALTRSADYLIRAGHAKWYANGNINLAYAETFYMALRASGEQRFADAYEAEWAFVVNPPTPRWAGYGLVFTKTPSRADGADGAGYLTEDGGRGPGYDPEYTQVQLDTASSLYVASGDPRALRLMNLFANQLLPRVDSTFTLDATGGSRHSLMTAFVTPALALLTRSGREDLAPMLSGQTARVVAEYRTFMGVTHPVYYRGTGAWLATLVMDSQQGAGSQIPTLPAGSAAGSHGASAKTKSDAAAGISITVPTTISRKRVVSRGVVAVVRGVPARSRLTGRLRNSVGAAAGPSLVVRKTVVRGVTRLTLRVRRGRRLTARSLRVQIIIVAAGRRTSTMSRSIAVRS